MRSNTARFSSICYFCFFFFFVKLLTVCVDFSQTFYVCLFPSCLQHCTFRPWQIRQTQKQSVRKLKKKVTKNIMNHPWAQAWLRSNGIFCSENAINLKNWLLLFLTRNKTKYLPVASTGPRLPLLRSIFPRSLIKTKYFDVC